MFLKYCKYNTLYFAVVTSHVVLKYCSCVIHVINDVMYNLRNLCNFRNEY